MTLSHVSISSFRFILINQDARLIILSFPVCLCEWFKADD